METRFLAFCLVVSGLYVVVVPVVMIVMEKSIVRRVEPSRPDDDFMSSWPPALAGFLLFQKVKKQFITATLISLANRGYLGVEETRHPLGRSFEFFLTAHSLKGLHRYEHDLMTHMFPENAKQVSDAALFGKLTSFMGKIYERIAEEIEKKRVFSNASALREVSFPYVAAVSGLLIVGLVVLETVYDRSALWIPVAALAVGIIEVGVFAHRVPRLTEHGKEVFGRVLAFKKFLDRLDHNCPDEELIQLLPYAVALHTETRKFAVVRSGEAAWYRSESREDDNLLPLIRAANAMQNSVSGEPAIFSYFEWLRTCGAGGYDRPRRR
ncbi:MAG: DUF2207 family protein [Candidatus Geothermincolia bacterium]